MNSKSVWDQYKVLSGAGEFIRMFECNARIMPFLFLLKTMNRKQKLFNYVITFLPFLSSWILNANLFYGFLFFTQKSNVNYLRGGLLNWFHLVGPRCFKRTFSDVYYRQPSNEYPLYALLLSINCFLANELTMTLQFSAPLSIPGWLSLIVLKEFICNKKTGRRIAGTLQDICPGSMPYRDLVSKLMERHCSPP